jgi:hypothetical protein
MASYKVHVTSVGGLFGGKVRKAKTKLAFVTQGNYGQGWEDVTEDETYSAGRQMLKDYNSNETQYPHRMIIRRVKVE